VNDGGSSSALSWRGGYITNRGGSSFCRGGSRRSTLRITTTRRSRRRLEKKPGSRRQGQETRASVSGGVGVSSGLVLGGSRASRSAVKATPVSSALTRFFVGQLRRYHFLRGQAVPRSIAPLSRVNEVVMITRSPAVTLKKNTYTIYRSSEQRGVGFRPRLDEKNRRKLISESPFGGRNVIFHLARTREGEATAGGEKVM